MIPLYHGSITDHATAISSDFLVVGAGVAGLRAAITLAAHGSVLVVAKDSLRESSSEYAQGGIAVALSDDDDIDLHEADTIAAGDGLCDRDAVHTLVEEGPAAIQELIDWGTAFDREGARLLFAREGAHSRSRVLHAYGDSTGREISRTLHQTAASLPQVRFQSFAAITDLLQNEQGRVIGAVACDRQTCAPVPIHARATLLATGGLGRVFRDTTNPDVATGDGVATAYRAGAQISDIEFVQFHPTALFVPGAPRFLLSEALRGEGAFLRNEAGERFMERYHPLAELAPRDVVSRSIVQELRRSGNTHVYLDLTHMPPGFVAQRFPRIYQTCLQHGVDIASQLVPVHPAVHYSMGGVRTDLDGRTSVPGLFAAGEVACTGVHGANRLASNSLLEGVVFGARAGRAMAESGLTQDTAARPPRPLLIPDRAEADLRQLTWQYCGIVRNAQGLSAAGAMLEADTWSRPTKLSRGLFELRNMHVIASLMMRCALAREESRGGHFREDFPEKSDRFQMHSLVQADGDVRFVPVVADEIVKLGS